MTGRVSFAFVFVAALITIVNGCGRNSAPQLEQGQNDVQPVTKVTIAYIPFTSAAQVFVAEEEDLFSAESIEVELLNCSSSNAALNAVLTGKAQFACGNGWPTLLPITEGQAGALQFFHPSQETKTEFANNLLVTVDSTVSGLKGLLGKRVGTYEGATQRNNLGLIFERVFGDAKAAEIVQVNTTLQLQALEAGQFDALFTIEPTSAIGVERGIAKVAEANLRVKYLLDPFPAAANSVDVEFAKSHPEVARRVILALEHAIDFIREHNEEARSDIAKHLSLDSTIESKMGMYEWEKLSEEQPETVQKLADLMHRTGELRQPIDVAPLFYHFDSQISE